MLILLVINMFPVIVGGRVVEDPNYTNVNATEDIPVNFMNSREFRVSIKSWFVVTRFKVFIFSQLFVALHLSGVEFLVLVLSSFLSSS